MTADDELEQYHGQGCIERMYRDAGVGVADTCPHCGCALAVRIHKGLPVYFCPQCEVGPPISDVPR